MIWDAHKYGFGCVYWLTVAGVPVIWTEKASGKTLPAGFDDEDASLVIDDSAEVGVEQIDRERGVSVSLALTFKLLDTDIVRDWLRRWSQQASLTAQLNVGGVTATVDSTTSWPATGEIHLGLERATYTGKNATQFTGLTRAESGSLAYEHRIGTTAQIVTDRPRFWRGREVVLWATPIDASGYIGGAALTDDAVQVWKGKIDEGPDRDVDGFVFRASSLDRILDQQLATQVTGTVKDTSVKYAVKAGTKIVIKLQSLGAGAVVWDYTLEFAPFAAYAAGDLLTGDEMRTAITAAFAAAVSAAGAGAAIGDLTWFHKNDTYTAQVGLVANAGIDQILPFVVINGKDFSGDMGAQQLAWPGASMPATKISLWKSAGDPAVPYDTGWPPDLTAITVGVDEGDPHDVPASGVVWLDNGQAKWAMSYAYTSLDGLDLYLAGLQQESSAGVPKLTPKQAAGMTATVQLSFVGMLPALMLKTLESSGNGQRGTYDTGARGSGYGIDDSNIDEDSFLAATAPLNSMAGTVVADGKSFAERIGGALGLFRKAVVCRPDTDDTYWSLRLTVVDTAPYGAGWSVTIGDDDLLSHEGDPVVSVKRADAPNAVKVIRKQGDSEEAMAMYDRDRIDAVGMREVVYEVPANAKAGFKDTALAAVATHFTADQTAQAVEVRVPPWIRAEVGDIVKVELTHPSLWTWSTSPGQVGYDGPARVVGRRLNLKTSQVTLTLLLDGSVKVRSLSPSAVVVDFDNAANPTWIEVDLKYLPHFAATIAANGNFHVLHYLRTGTETDAEGYEISAAAEIGGRCRLTVAAKDGAPVLSLTDESYLTLPTTSGGDLVSYQGNFAHIDDGTQWG